MQSCSESCTPAAGQAGVCQQEDEPDQVQISGEVARLHISCKIRSDSSGPDQDKTSAGSHSLCVQWTIPRPGKGSGGLCAQSL